MRGFPPEKNLEKLFSAFSQDSDDKSGLGLGLTISKKAVLLNGGQLEVKNIPNHGCIFTISLPQPVLEKK